MYRTASIYCCFVHDVCIRSVARYLISMEHGDRVVFVARPFLCCDYRSIIRTIFTRGEFIVIHLIQRSNRIDTSVNDHRFLLAFSLSLSLSIRRLLYPSHRHQTSPEYLHHIPFSLFSFLRFHISTISRIAN